ncbi:MAG: hypothetical protein D3908_00910, partial [Candidatus Electrothrix sp. AUS4]|nr:hypothetical protein [Candidatus Electrothrix sp. AUS4]
MSDCQENKNEHRLVREGTTQGERFSAALDPASAPVDERGVEQGIAYARAYAKFLQYYDAGNNKAGDWQPFFSKDVSALLAIMAIQDVEKYRANIKKYLGTLEKEIIKNEKKQKIEIKELDKKNLGKLFSCIGMLARQLDILKEGLPKEYPLKGILHNVITNRLSAEFKNLICCHRQLFDDKFCPLQNVVPSFKVIQSEANIGFADLLEQYEFSTDWVIRKEPENEAEPEQKDEERSWRAYLRDLYDPKKLKCSDKSKPDKFYNEIKLISNHFLKVYARTVTEARQAFGKSLKWDRHDLHYTLFLAFLRLLEHARNEMNTLTGKHLDFYYRDILRFKEKEIVPPKAHILVELAKKVPSHLIKAGELFKAGKDELGKDVFFASVRNFVANRAQVAELKTVYRHGDEPITEEGHPNKHNGRLYASSVANSADGVGGELITEDKSWHPFFNKIYKGRELSKIEMPKAEVGFAIASHYLWMAGGTRTVTLSFTSTDGTAWDANFQQNKDVLCFFTGPEGWIAGEIEKSEEANALQVKLSGSDPAVVPYSAKIHKDYFENHLLNLKTDSPVLLVKLNHQDEEKYSYDALEDLKFNKIDLAVKVENLKPLIVSNDFGPVDTSKPFQPFGGYPVEGSALTIGLKEVFQQEKIKYIKADIIWQGKDAKIYPKDNNDKRVEIEYLQNGSWYKYDSIKKEDGSTEGDGNKVSLVKASNNLLEDHISLFGDSYTKEEKIISPYIGNSSFEEQEYISSSSVNGFVRIKLNEDFGQKEYENAILGCAVDEGTQKKTPIKVSNCINVLLPQRPEGPSITELTIGYETEPQEITINPDEDANPPQASFFHVAPFGCAEQYLPDSDTSSKDIDLLPHLALPLEEEDLPPGRDAVPEAAEFYIGITDLKPPQNLSLLFQVADGTANPKKIKPKQHIQWSCLGKNEWIDFPQNTVEDNTNGLITSGIINFSMPREATDDNTLLPAEKHWIRAVVKSAPDAVCRLRMVAAQALKVQFVDKENDPNFSAKTLPKESISKLARPSAAIKKITQPFPSYGGRGKEDSKAFYTRVSERLRHKDRAITLWDYERLVLEAFPEVHKVKCLNHTRPKTNQDSDKQNYNEMAPGHVTVVVIADEEHHSLPDPLRPNVSLGLLEKIKQFLKERCPSLSELYVVNPTFEEVHAEFRVKFHNGFDQTYYKNMLQESLIRFLSPWAFPGGGSPSFGGKIYRSALINFVEEQHYVDYVTCFSLNGNNDQPEIKGESAGSILVSAPPSGHNIHVITAAEEESLDKQNSCDK